LIGILSFCRRRHNGIPTLIAKHLMAGAASAALDIPAALTLNGSTLNNSVT
jgi:hypothetical protein